MGETTAIEWRNRVAYWLYMRWPISQNMPQWSYRVSLWLSPMAAAWAYRPTPAARGQG
jgi:hypothetical protein